MPIGDPPRTAAHGEAELEETSSERLAVRHPREVADLFKKFDVSGHNVLVIEGKQELPLRDLSFELNVHVPYVIT